MRSISPYLPTSRRLDANDEISHLPTSPHISPYLPTSRGLDANDEISHLPTSPHISRPRCGVQTPACSDQHSRGHALDCVERRSAVFVALVLSRCSEYTARIPAPTLVRSWRAGFYRGALASTSRAVLVTASRLVAYERTKALLSEA